MLYKTEELLSWIENTEHLYKRYEDVIQIPKKFRKEKVVELVNDSAEHYSANNEMYIGKIYRNQLIKEFMNE